MTKRWLKRWPKATDPHDQSTATGARGVLLIGLLLTAGLVGWWSVAPGQVLGERGDAGGVLPLVVTALLILPVALLAAGAAAWFARRQRWPRLTTTGLLKRAGATAGLFAALLLATAPVQHAVYERTVPPPLNPNLAAIEYSVSCPPVLSAAECRQAQAELGAVDAETVGSYHRAMLQHTGHSTAAYSAITGDFYPEPAGLGADAAAYAVQDASVALAVALPLALLGTFLVARVVPAAAAASRRRGITRIRSRWVAVGGAVVMVVTGSLVFVSAASAQPQQGAFVQQLKIPPVLEGSEVTLEMAETDIQIMPDGPPTTMWTFNGTFPGPTIRRPSGETTKLTVRNELPPSFGESSIHHHGAHSESSEDGQPDDFLIEGGGLRTYTYDHFERGEAEWAATQWYHDHRMDVTGRNVWNGLFGLFILDDPVEEALPLPKGEFDVPLVLADRSFDENNQIPYEFNFNGTTGDTVLINGTPEPYFDVGDRKYRFRVMNGSNRRPFRLSLSNDQEMLHIGTESGLLPEPVARTTIDLAPAERAEIVIDFAGQLGEDIVLEHSGGGGGNGGGDGGNGDGGGGGGAAELMQFRVNRDLSDNSHVPSTLRPLPHIPAEPDVTREFTLDLTDGLWTINGLPFDTEHIHADPKLGDTERWIFTNVTEQPHALHIHDVDWLLESRDGEPPPPWEDALKETWFIQPGETISLRTTFTDHLGTYVFHCHMLEHEDLAMMAQFEVMPPD